MFPILNESLLGIFNWNNNLSLNSYLKWRCFQLLNWHKKWKKKMKQASYGNEAFICSLGERIYLLFFYLFLFCFSRRKGKRFEEICYVFLKKLQGHMTSKKLKQQIIKQSQCGEPHDLHVRKKHNMLRFHSFS